MNEIMTAKEVAQYIRMNERTVSKLAQEGAIPAAKIASQWRFMKSLIDEWIESKMFDIPAEHLNGIVGTAGKIVPLSKLFHKDTILLDLKAKTKSEALKEMVDALVSTGRMKEGKGFLRQLRDREKLMSTGIGRGVAVPHPRHAKGDIFKQALIVFGRSSDGIDYDAVDKQPVNLIFLICAPNDCVHLRQIAKLGRVLQDEKVIKQLAAATSKDKVIDIIRKREKELPWGG